MRHGGDISNSISGAAAGDRRMEPWLDLSTGIAPAPYPFTPPGAETWQRLPQTELLNELVAAARHAYGMPEGDGRLLAAPGTQVLIQLMPYVVAAARVAIVGPTYFEHAVCWQRTAGDVEQVGCLPDGLASGADLVVVTNPNNPDGRIVPRCELLAAADSLSRRGGLLVVDEAFADVSPQMSVAAEAGNPGLIVLRSFGKFYGLAGMRLGFALGPARPVDDLAEMLGPWQVSGPAIAIGREALRDTAWAASARERYRALAARLDHILARHGFEIVGGTSLFRLVAAHDPEAVVRDLASARIAVRCFPEIPPPRNNGWLRFGLPGDDAGFERLDAALRERACS